MRIYLPCFLAFLMPWQASGWQASFSFPENSPLCLVLPAIFGHPHSDPQDRCLRNADGERENLGDHRFGAAFLDTIFTSEVVQICEGETASIFGVPTSLPGDYSQVFVAANGGDSIHTISLLVNPVPSLAFETQLACPFQNDGVVTALPSGGLPPFLYVWETGNDSSAQLSGLDVGVYALTVTDAAGCTAVDSIELEAAARPLVSSMVTDLTCFNAGDGVLLILADDPNLRFSFNGSPIGPQTVFDSVFAGGHEFFVIDTFGCIWEQFFNVDSPDPLELSLPADRHLEQGDSFRISSQTTAAPLGFEWSPTLGLSCADCPDPVAMPDTTTRYFLTVTDAHGCTAVADILLTVDLVPAVKVPNAFSPNGDGVNDRFYVLGDALAEVRFLRIFDRWGNLVFEKTDFPANDPMNGWDGQYRGKPAVADVFVFYLSVGLLDGSVRFVKGDLTLLR